MSIYHALENKEDEKERYVYIYIYIYEELRFLFSRTIDGAESYSFSPYI